MGAVIDLGLDRAPPALTGQPRPRPGVYLRRWRQPALAVVWGVVLAGVLTPAAPAAPPSPLALVVERQSLGEDYIITGDLLFIQESTNGTEPPPVWSAHQLPAGDYLWSTPDWPAHSPRGASVVWTFARDLAGLRWVARDPVSGDELWSTPHAVTPVPGTGLVVVTGDRTAVQITEEQYGVQQATVAVVDAMTGAPLWSSRPDVSMWQIVLTPEEIVLASDGAVEVRELRTGRLSAAGRLTRDLPLGVVDDVLVMGTSFDDGPAPSGVTLGAYDLRTLALRWEARLSPPTADRHAWGMALDSRIAYWYGRSGVSVVDYHTGAVHSLDEERRQVRRFGDAVVLFDADEWPREVMDLATGTVVADLARWRLVEPVTSEVTDLLIVRNSPAGTVLASVNLVTGERSFLGVEPRPMADCQEFDGGLVCRAGGRLTLWRWR